MLPLLQKTCNVRNYHESRNPRCSVFHVFPNLTIKYSLLLPSNSPTVLIGLPIVYFFLLIFLQIFQTLPLLKDQLQKTVFSFNSPLFTKIMIAIPISWNSATVSSGTEKINRIINLIIEFFCDCLKTVLCYSIISLC